MNKAFYPIAIICIVLLVLLVAKIFSLSGIVEMRDKNFGTTIVALQDSVAKLQHQVEALKQQVPGLGEYMSTVQLHVAKLWFAEQASNWELSYFELNELNEAIDASKELHVVKNNVDITSVLQSVQNTQLQSLSSAVQNKQQASFGEAYNQTLDACNGCHRSAGYGYIHVTIPTAPPVTNQRWTAGG